MERAPRENEWNLHLPSASSAYSYVQGNQRRKWGIVSLLLFYTTLAAGAGVRCGREERRKKPNRRTGLARSFVSFRLGLSPN